MALLTYIVFLIFLPLGQWLRFNLTNGLSLVPLDLAVFSLSIIYILRRYKTIRGEFLRPMSLFLAVLALSLVINYRSLSIQQFIISGFYLIRLASYFSIYFLIKDIKKTLDIHKLMLISGTTLLLIGVIQYIFYPDLRNLYYLGWDEHLHRLFSSFLDPNFAGSFFVLYFMFLLKKPSRNKIYLILELVSIIVIFLTYSRSAYIMLVVSVLTYLILKRKLKFAAVFLFLFVISITVLSKASLYSEGTNLLRTASSEARLDSAKNALVIFGNNPFLGVGFNSYRYSQHKYGFLTKNWENIHSGAGTDNSFLFILATSGIVGFIFYVYLLFAILRSSVRSRSSYSVILFSSLAGLIADSLFVNSLFYPPILLWLMMLLGLRENR